MSDKLKDLEIKKLIKEYDYLLLEDEYKKQFIEEHTQSFLSSINEKRKEMGVEYKESQTINNKEKKQKEEEKIIEVNRETRRKIKDIFRKIVKLTHPDKTNSEKLVNIYIKAKKFYEQNNLLELYLICIDLHIDIDLSDFSINDMIKTIEVKKNELINLEKSYLWLWVNAKTDSEKENIIKIFIEKNG